MMLRKKLWRLKKKKQEQQKRNKQQQEEEIENDFHQHLLGKKDKPSTTFCSEICV